MTTGLIAIVVCLVAASLGMATVDLLRNEEYRRGYVATVRAIRWWMWPAATAHVAVVVGLSVGLLVAIPVLRYGWWLMLGGSGNAVLGQTGLSGGFWQLVGLVIPMWVMVLVPHFAHREEMCFRYACEGHSPARRVKRQVVFGLGHLIMGIPIAAGLALIGSGLLFQRVYLTTFSRLRDRTDVTAVAPKPARMDYPPTPEGPYDGAAWHAHHEQFNSVITENRRVLDEWLDQRVAQENERKAQIDGIRDQAAATAAAFHAVGNWLIIGLLLVVLLAVA